MVKFFTFSRKGDVHFPAEQESSKADGPGGKNQRKQLLEKRDASVVVGKRELSRIVAKQLNVSISQTNELVDAVLASITEALKSGQSVRFSGFGRFHPLKPRFGKFNNPKTGATGISEGLHSVSFKPSGRLKAALN